MFAAFKGILFHKGTDVAKSTNAQPSFSSRMQKPLDLTFKLNQSGQEVVISIPVTPTLNQATELDSRLMNKFKSEAGLTSEQLLHISQLTNGFLKNITFHKER